MQFILVMYQLSCKTIELILLMCVVGAAEIVIIIILATI